jgi:hypothetical protein
VSDGTHKKRFVRTTQGVWALGKQKPAAFVKLHADKLRAFKVTQSEIYVIIAVAENEGKLDAIDGWTGKLRFSRARLVNNRQSSEKVA